MPNATRARFRVRVAFFVAPVLPWIHFLIGQYEIFSQSKVRLHKKKAHASHRKTLDGWTAARDQGEMTEATFL